jgi:hypothetical protein
MNAYVYCWDLRPRPDIRVKLQIEAVSASAAHRELEGFLCRHEARAWRAVASVAGTRSARNRSPRLDGVQIARHDDDECRCLARTVGARADTSDVEYPANPARLE